MLWKIGEGELSRKGTQYYDVTMRTIDRAEEVRRVAIATANEELRKYAVIPLYRNDYRIMTVHMYNPWVTEETIRYFLGRYVTVFPGVRIIKDGLGIWTGKRQFHIKLEGDLTSEDGYRHPPAVFSIGADRGLLVYLGQPQSCRKCGGHGHMMDNCDQVRCRNCGSMGHATRDCSKPKRCHLCDSDSQMARDCTKPRPSAAVLKGDAKRDNGEEKEGGEEDVMGEEVRTGEANEADEVEGGVKGNGAGFHEEERQSDEDSFRVEKEGKEEYKQQWKVVKRSRRKASKKRRIVSPVVSPEDNQVDEKVGDVLTEIMDSYAPKGTYSPTLLLAMKHCLHVRQRTLFLCFQ